MLRRAGKEDVLYATSAILDKGYRNELSLGGGKEKDLHDYVKTSEYVADSLGKLLVVPVEGKRGWGTVGIERGVGVYVIAHELHRRY